MIENKTITFDIEAMEPSWLTDYQKKLLGGFNAKDLAVIASSRGSGKSVYYQYQYWMANHMTLTYKHLTSSTVDGEPWHTIQCNESISKWIRGNNNKSWYEHAQDYPYVHSKFDISDKLYTMMQVGFSD